MPQSGKLPVLNLLAGQNQVFRPAGAIRCTDSRQTWRGRLAPGSPWLCIISRQSAKGMWMWPQNIENFHFLKNSRLAGVNPLTDFECFRFFYTTTYPPLTFQIWLDSLHRTRSNCWETARRSIRPFFSVHPVGKTTRCIEKCFAPFLMALTSSITLQSLGRSSNERQL